MSSSFLKWSLSGTQHRVRILQALQFLLCFQQLLSQPLSFSLRHLDETLEMQPSFIHAVLFLLLSFSCRSFSFDRGRDREDRVVWRDGHAVLAVVRHGRRRRGRRHGRKHGFFVAFGKVRDGVLPRVREVDERYFRGGGVFENR